MGIKLAIILGSGIEIESSRTSDVKILREDSNGIHNKKIFTCLFEGKEVLVLQGRKHFYEGYSINELVENINFVDDFGAENLLITNAAGGVNDNFGVAELMLIKSYVNLNSLLKFKRYAFPFSPELSDMFCASCTNAGVKLHEGIYGFYQGPTYETKAEIRFQKKYNIDAAGMSTVPEINDAYSKGIRVIAVSVITNLLKENDLLPADHSSVVRTAFEASRGLNKALSELISQLN